jgi:GAF domain-containing protein/HAMP domain-containing protein
MPADNSLPTLISPLIAQYAAWMLALLQLILGLYLWVVSTWQSKTRRGKAGYVFLFLILLALNTFGAGGLAGSTSSTQAGSYSALMAISSPALIVALLLATISLLRPDWLGQRSRWLARLLVFLVLWVIPVTLLDILFAHFDIRSSTSAAEPVRLWYSGIDTANYAGGYVLRDSYTGGILEPLVIILNFILSGLAGLGFLVWVIIKDSGIANRFRRDSKKKSRPSQPGGKGVEANAESRPDLAHTRLAWLLLFTYLPALAISSISQPQTSLMFLLLSNGLLTLAYAFAIYTRLLQPAAIEPDQSETDQVVETAAPRSASLQTRLVSAAIVITLPLLAAMGLFLNSQARRQLEVEAQQRLSSLNQSLGRNVEDWLDTQISTLQALAASPGIISMDAAQQQSILESTAAVYTDLYLLATLDVQGVGLARTDQQVRQDYSSQIWFEQASKNSTPIYLPLVGRDIWKPDLVIVTPIQDQAGNRLGYVMALTTLRAVSTRLQETRLGENGFAILVDDQYRLLAHPDWAQTFVQTQYGLQDLSGYAPVAELVTLNAQGAEISSQALYRFTGNDGLAWQASLGRLNNGWGLVVQQREAELFAPIATFQTIAFGVLIAGGLLLVPLLLLTVRNSLLPIRQLTETAQAIATGDLTRLAPVEIAAEGGDIGLLAGTFNQMTNQLRGLIGGLEERVSERTQVVQRRAIQLQVTAEVARDAASIHDAEELLESVVRLISEKFGFYHVGIFMTEARGGSEDRGFAVLRAASSEGGKRMLARHHRLKIGPPGVGAGIVGTVAASGEARISLDVGADAAFFNNPDLPLTRSEMALPLVVLRPGERGELGRRVSGVLDVQSTLAAAFTREDVEILQILADQIALALENARLLRESQEALKQLQEIYGQRVRMAWKKRLAEEGGITYTFSSTAMQRVEPAEERERVSGEITTGESTWLQPLEVALDLRGQRLGQLVLKREQTWSQQEVELVQEAMSQVALAVENARLLEEIQQRAFQEEMINQIIARAQGSLDLETVMQTLVLELSQIIDTHRVQIRLGDPSLRSTGDPSLRSTGDPSLRSAGDPSLRSTGGTGGHEV